MTLDYDLALLVGGSIALGLRTVAGLIDWWTSDMRRGIPYSSHRHFESVPEVTTATGGISGGGWRDHTPELFTRSFTRLSWLCLGITTLVSRPLELAS